MIAKKKKVVEEAKQTPQATPTTIKKGPHHIVKDGEVILDPNFTNPGVFSS